MLRSSRGMVLFSCFHTCVQASELGIVRPEFEQMDTNKDGFVIPAEIQAHQIQNFKKLDCDNDGDIGPNVRLISINIAAYPLMDKCAVDSNNDGKITQDEYSSNFAGYFKQMDKNRDGRVSEAEYTDYWKLIHKF